MTRFFTVSFLVSSFSLTACDGAALCDAACDESNGSDQDGTDNDGSGSPTDTSSCSESCDSGDTGVELGTATLTFDVYRMGVLESALVNIGDVTESSGTPVEVVAPADYTVMAGDSSHTERFGFPVHVDQEGEYWAAPPADVSVQNGDALPGRFDLFNLFEPGDYACNYDEYYFDASAADYKGEYKFTDELKSQRISIDQNGQVHAEDDPDMGVAGRDNEDKVQVVDDHLILVVAEFEGEDPYLAYITVSMIKKNEFSLTIVNETTGYVDDLACTN